MAFYGINNLFGTVSRSESEKKEAREKEKAEQEATKTEEAASQEKQALAQEQEQAQVQAEAQRQRLLQLQDKVARRLEDFVKASGREHTESADHEADSLMQYLANSEGDSFTPENLQRLRQLSQSARNAVSSAREGRGEAHAGDEAARPREEAKAEAQTRVTAAQDFELQARRAMQDAKAQMGQAEEQAAGRRAEGKERAAEPGRTDPAKPEARQESGGPARPDPSGAKADGPRTEGAAPKADGLPRPESKADLPRPESKAETPRPEARADGAPRPEARADAKAEAATRQEAKAEGPGAPRAEAEEAPPPPPRPDAMRARPDAPAAKASPEAKGEAGGKAPEGPEPGPEQGPRLARPEGQPRGQQAPADARGPQSRPGEPGSPTSRADRPGADPQQARASLEGEPARPGMAAPEGPRTAKGQEVAGGASRTGNTRPEGDRTRRAGEDPGRLGEGKPGTGKESEAGARWSATGLGIRPGGSSPFLRPGDMGQAFPRPGQGEAEGPQAGRPGAGGPADPEPALPTEGRAPAGGAEVGSRGVAIRPGAPPPPRTPSPTPAEPKAPDAQAGKPDPEGPALEEGPRWTTRGVGPIGSPSLPPRGLPQGRPEPGPGAGQDPARQQPVRPPVDSVAPPFTNPAGPRPDQVLAGPVRIPPPDGGKDPGEKKSTDRADDEMEVTDIGGVGRSDGARPARPPGVTPVRGPRQERGPVGEVKGWLPEDSPEGPQPGWRSVGGVGARPSPHGPVPGGDVGMESTIGSNPVGYPSRHAHGSRPVAGPGAPSDHFDPGQPNWAGAAGAVGGGGGHLNYELLRRSPFRADPAPIDDLPGQARPGMESVGPVGAGRQGETLRGPAAPGLPGAEPAEGADPDAPRVEFLRPRATAPPPARQGGLFDAASRPRPHEGLAPPGGPPPAAQVAEAAERVRLAAQVMSGEAPGGFMPGAAGPVGRVMDPILPGEIREVMFGGPNRKQEPMNLIAVNGIPQGAMTGGRPVTSHIPIYQPMLDLIYQVRGRAKVEQESIPIKMALSGSVGVLDRQTYTRHDAPWMKPPSAEEAPPEPAPRTEPRRAEARGEAVQRQAREAAPLAQRVVEASDQNPLLGAMTAAFMGPGEAARQDKQAPPPTKADGTAVKGEVEAQAVTETGSTRGKGGGAGSEGGEQGDRRGGGESRGSGGTGPGGTAGPGASPEAQAKMQAFRLASSHEAFRITMDKLENQFSMRRFDVAVRNANVSIESILKRVYRDQELADLDETEAVNCLALMLKMGGEFTYAHSARVLDLAMDLADEMGITDEQTRRQIELGAMLKDIGEMEVLLQNESEAKIDKITSFMSTQDMLRAGLLHDIGKLRIPPDILHKPGRMTEAEYAIMRMHPIYGEQMIYPIASLRHLCPTIRGHHERWDGKGYPDGLRGERIPLPARILAVADVFDALHAERPYKSGMDVGRVRAILEEGRGTHFDPDCVDAFLRILDRRHPQAATRRRAYKPVLESVDA